MKHFEPGQPILFRCNDNSAWSYSLYNRITTCGTEHLIVGGCFIKDKNILPYNDSTKYLLGTENDYIEWEPEPNTVIAVRHNENHSWKYRKFVYKDGDKYACVVEDDENEIHLWGFATSIEESLKD